LNEFIQTPTFFQLLGLCTLGAVLMGMLTNAAFIPAWFHRNDKFMHFVAFGALAGMAHGAWPRLDLWVLWGLITTLGVLAEVAQHLTVNRRFCWRDALANALGAASVLLVLSCWRA